MHKMKSFGSVGNLSSGRLSTDQEYPNHEDHDHQDVSRLAISTCQAREEEIERMKMEVKERVELQLGRAEEETRRLAQIWEVSCPVFVFFFDSESLTCSQISSFNIFPW